jgi:hypothetical protein
MQKAPCAVTGDFDHATVGEQGSLHGKKLSKYRQERRIPADFSQGSDIWSNFLCTQQTKTRSDGPYVVNPPVTRVK